MNSVDSVSILKIGTWRHRAQLFGIWVCRVAVVVSSLWAIGAIVMIQFNPAYAPVAAVSPEVPPAEPYTFALDLAELTFPIFSKNQNRVLYGRFSLSLDCSSRDNRAELERSRSRIIDLVLSVAANYYYEDFSEVSGLERFKTELLTSLNYRFPRVGPRRLSISDWTIG